MKFSIIKKGKGVYYNMAELFDKAKSTINEHIKNIYQEGELSEVETMRKFGNPEFSTKPTKNYIGNWLNT